MPAVATLNRLIDHVRHEKFRDAHPRLAGVLQSGYPVYRALRRRRYGDIYKKFQTHTRLKRQSYMDNLAICDQLSIRTLSGAVIECGTWRGGMIAGMASLFGPERNYYLFDSYEGLPAVDESEGLNRYGVTAKAWQAETTHNECADERDAREAMHRSGARHVTVTKGWFSDTLSSYSGGPIAILRADGDWYESTQTILNELATHVVPSGIIILDDYHYWDGCARATHEFLAKHGDAWRMYRHGDYSYLLRVR